MSRVQDTLSRVALLAGTRKKTKDGQAPKKDDAAVGEFVDIITFVEKAEWGLRMRLFPVQRIILKAHYGIPLDTVERFEITDWRRENVRLFTEAEYLEHLFKEGRSNIRTVIPGQERRNLILSIGRRSGKSTLAAAIGAYEIYRLIHKLDPHTFYGIALTQYISLIAVATSREQAGELYGKVSGHFEACSFFRRFRSAVTQTSARFQTPADVTRYGSFLDNPKARASVRISFHACNAKGLRGKGNIVVILDEFAHFNAEGGSSDEKVYEAVSPSTSDFSPKDANGRPLQGHNTRSDARIIMISSPLGKQGLFYRQFQLGMRGDASTDNMLCIQAPTWEVNPTLPAGEFRQKFAENAVAFFTEYGADFSDRSLGWIEDRNDLLQCVSATHRSSFMGNPRISYYLGFDLGLVNDPSSVAIVHNEPSTDGKSVEIVLDHIDEIQAKKGKYKARERLDFDEISDWLLDLSKRFHIKDALFDQWNHIPLEQALIKRGLTQFRSEYMGSQLNSQIYQNFKAQLWDQKIRLFDLTESERKAMVLQGEKLPDEAPFAPYLNQLLSLQAEVKSKYIVDVRAPHGANNHDDLADALARAVWLASQNLSKHTIIAGGSTRDRGAFSSQAQVMRDRMRLGGSSPERQVLKPKRQMLTGMLNFRQIRR